MMTFGYRLIISSFPLTTMVNLNIKNIKTVEEVEAALKVKGITLEQRLALSDKYMELIGELEKVNREDAMARALPLGFHN